MSTTTTTLTQASAQWASRPDDERFWDIQELFDKTSDYRQRSVQTQLQIKNCTLVPHEGTLKGVTEFTSRHIGEKFFDKVAQLYQAIEKATELSSEEDIERLKKTKNILIAEKPEDVIEFVADRTTLPVSFVRKGHEMAMLTADAHHASPNSVWGMYSGLTRVSQAGHADKRDKLDRLSAKLLSIDF